MKSKKFLSLFAILLTAFSLTASAEEVAAPAGMDPAAMEKMQTLMAPNENHKVLEAFVGKWTYTGKFQMMPDAPAQEMAGTSTGEMVYGGRFLKQDFEGPWMGSTFHGLGYTGYDTIKKAYVSTWMDDVSPFIMVASGQYDAASKTLNLSGANSCPMTGETDRKGRSEWVVTDADHNTYKSYSYGPDGKEFLVMEINYTRAA